MSRRNDNNLGCGCIAFFILVLITLFDKYWMWTVPATLIAVICYFVVKKRAKTPVIKPEYEIKYKDVEGNVTTRKIAVMEMNGSVLRCFCFLREAERTFYVSRILECIDISTGEIIKENLMLYFIRKYKSDQSIKEIFYKDDFEDVEFVHVDEFPDEFFDFELKENLSISFVSYKYGLTKGTFYCSDVKESNNECDYFYLKLFDSSGKEIDVGLSKVISVDGIENFREFLIEKFYQSDSGKAVNIINSYNAAFLILVYLGRADSPLNAKKRAVINDYMNYIGAECNENVVSIAAKKVKVELPKFKKLVDFYSESINKDFKERFVLSAKNILGNKTDSKPFGVAGLQYIETKFKL